MGAKERQEFLDAAAKASQARMEEWGAAVAALTRMAMFDMIPAFAALPAMDKFAFFGYCSSNKGKIGEVSYNRIAFARCVVLNAEIKDFGIPLEQVNDGREYLGCTRLDDKGVQDYIDKALAAAGAAILNKEKGTDYARSGLPDANCCGKVGVAWSVILVGQRREKPGASLISNLAAAAHYMLARYHVCMAKAREWQMNWVTEGYDAQKRATIAGGDRELKSMALTANRPFPPDYAITEWAKKGSADGEADRKRCNSLADQPWIVPIVNKKEWGFE